MKNFARILPLAIFAAPSFATDVFGTISDATGKPIANATVAIYSTNITVNTDANGRYRVTDLKPGHYHAHVSAANFVQKDFELHIKDENINADFALSPSTLDNIIVTASALNRSTLESASPVSVLAGEELVLRQAPTLGETLKSEPGIHASYFGPVSSSPIIRGQDGPRVKITQNGLNSGDASRVGSDHAIATETATATQIEVLRGPATLLYGSGAIGGVVNVVDNRIPQTKPEAFEGSIDARYDSVSSGQTVSADLNGHVNNFAWHLDGFYRDSDNYELAEGGELANSDIDASGFTAGFSYLLDDGFIGFSYGRIDNKYGIPGHSHGHDEHDDDHDEDHDDEHDEDHDEDHDDEHEEEERVLADMQQDRYQMLASFSTPFAGIQKADVKLAYTEYKHSEIEEDIVGTTFTNDTTEARIDLFHNPIGEWQGVVGMHYEFSDYSAFGDEAFTPPSETESLAIFIVEERDFDNISLSLGARFETVDIDPEGEIEEHGGEVEQLASVDYSPFSASAGIVWQFADEYSLATSYAYSQRAPSAAELFALGEHVATQTFDVGGQYEVEVEDDGHVEFHLADGDMDKEISNNIDVTLRKFGGTWGASFTVFYNQVDDYIYQADTGLHFEGEHDHHSVEDHDEHGEEEGLPIFVYEQADAEFYGYEAELNFKLSEEWKLEVFSDYIRGKLDAGGNLPRIPPLRVGSRLNWDVQNWHVDVGATWYDKQTDIAEFETETDSYTMLESSISYFTSVQDTDINLFLRATNLTDEDAQVHSSFIKEQAPLPGRNITAGIKVTF